MSGAIGRARHVPTRSCVACRTARPKRELVRIVRTPDGRVVIDETGRLPGRGAYLCRTGGCGQKAVAKGILGRALGVALPADVRAALETTAGPAGAGGAAGPAGTNETTTSETTMMSDEGGAGGQE